MRYPVQTQDTPRLFEPLLSVLSVAAVGIFIGAWVLGPAMTHESRPASSDKEHPLSYEEMVARPDPWPYRAATPAFDVSNQPNYGSTAREKARAEIGGHRTANSGGGFEAVTSGDGSFEQPQNSRSYRSYRSRDPHSGVF
jgi:hypothetical protein